MNIKNKFADITKNFKLLFYKNMFKRMNDKEEVLTSTEYFCLECIYLMEKPTITQFAQFLEISSPNATYKVKQLIKKGFIRKEKLKKDGRKFILVPTQKFFDFYDNKEFDENILNDIKKDLSELDDGVLVKKLQVINEKKNEKKERNVLVKDITIRLATIKDLKLCQDFRNQLYTYEIENFDNNIVENWSFSSYGKNDMKMALKNGKIFLAFDGVKAVGYLNSYVMEETYLKEKVARLDEIFVRDDSRGQGVGRLLVDAFIDFYIKEDIHIIRVKCDFKNDDAISFYKHLGFDDLHLELDKKI